MQRKQCDECGADAEVSICQIISTIGRAPRQQKCSESKAFCAACLAGRFNLLRRLGLRSLQQPASEALTALAETCGMRLNRQRRSRTRGQVSTRTYAVGELVGNVITAEVTTGS